MSGSNEDANQLTTRSIRNLQALKAEAEAVKRNEEANQLTARSAATLNHVGMWASGANAAATSPPVSFNASSASLRCSPTAAMSA